jgi:hypothetical protein
MNEMMQTQSSTGAQQQQQQVPIYEPNPYDIKCGQDKAYELHYGNQLLRTKMKESAPRYQQIALLSNDSGKKKLKSFLIKQIVWDMRMHCGSRFLRFDRFSQSWIEIPERLAHEKVSHSLRTYMKKHYLCCADNSSSCSDGDTVVGAGVVVVDSDTDAKPSAVVSAATAPVRCVSPGPIRVTTIGRGF